MDNSNSRRIQSFGNYTMLFCMLHSKFTPFERTCLLGLSGTHTCKQWRSQRPGSTATFLNKQTLFSAKGARKRDVNSVLLFKPPQLSTTAVVLCRVVCLRRSWQVACRLDAVLCNNKKQCHCGCDARFPKPNPTQQLVQPSHLFHCSENTFGY